MGIDNNKSMVGYRVVLRVRDFGGLEVLGRGLVEMGGRGLIGFVKSHRGSEVLGSEEGSVIDLVLGFNYFGEESNFVFGGGGSSIEVELFERYEIVDRSGEVDRIWGLILEWSIRYWGFNFWVRSRRVEFVRARHIMVYVCIKVYEMEVLEVSRRSGYSESMCYKIMYMYFGKDSEFKDYVGKISLDINKVEI